MIAQNGTKPGVEAVTDEDAVELAYVLGRIEGKLDSMVRSLDASLALLVAARVPAEA